MQMPCDKPAGPTGSPFDDSVVDGRAEQRAEWQHSAPRARGPAAYDGLLSPRVGHDLTQLTAAAPKKQFSFFGLSESSQVEQGHAPSLPSTPLMRSPT